MSFGKSAWKALVSALVIPAWLLGCASGGGGATISPAEWVAKSKTGSYLVLADKADVWSDSKPFGSAAGKITVQSKFVKHFGTTCVYDVQFNNIGTTNAAFGVTIGSSNKAEALGHRITDVKVAAGKSAAYQMEHRACPLRWGEHKDMGMCASCEPILFGIKNN